MAGHAGSWRVRQIRVLIALLVAAAGLAGCTRGGDHDLVQASISVSPLAALVDQPVAVTVRGLPAGARTTLTAKARDTDGITWSATAQFKATSAGEVSLDQPSLGGSYTGANPIGLFTLLAAPPGSAAAVFRHGAAGYDVELEASVNGRAAATATAKRQGPTAVILTGKRLRPTKGGIYGNLYLPKHTAARRPAVLVFSGSGGGLTTSMAAALLAAHGYPALAYFKAPGLPQTLTSIPLEYFTKALGVLRAQPGVDPDHVLVAGVSRGGEAALLLGAHFPRVVNGVIAGVPSSVVNPGLPDTSKPAWTLRRRPSPGRQPVGVRAAQPAGQGPGGHPGRADPRPDPARLRRAGPDLALLCLQRRYHRAPARPPVRPSGDRVALSRCRSPHRRPHRLVRSLTDDALTSSGGTVAATQAAQVDAHAKLLAFLASQ